MRLILCQQKIKYILATFIYCDSGTSIEYLKYRADLNVEVNFKINGVIGTIATKWDVIYSENLLFSSIIYNFK